MIKNLLPFLGRWTSRKLFLFFILQYCSKAGQTGTIKKTLILQVFKYCIISVLNCYTCHDEIPVSKRFMLTRYICSFPLCREDVNVTVTSLCKSSLSSWLFTYKNYFRSLILTTYIVKRDPVTGKWAHITNSRALVFHQIR